MADFQANIKAVLDTSGIERQITNEINNRRVNFSNITVNTANLVQQIIIILFLILMEQTSNL